MKKNLILSVLMLSVLVMMVGVVSAAHTSDVTIIADDWLTAEESTDFTIDVTNTGTDAIKRVIIEIPSGYSNLDCGVAPTNWDIYIDDGITCGYRTTSDFITNGNSEDFTLEVITSSDLDDEWLVTTIDEQSASYNNNVAPTGWTIQDAIDNADEDDTIVVPAGTYDETIIINKDGLTLLGAQANVDPRPMNGGRSGAESIIQRTYTTTSDDVNPIEIDADDVTINGFTISPHYEDTVGILANNDVIRQNPGSWEGTTISYNILTATGYNVVDNCDELIQLKGVTDAVIEYNYGYHADAEESGGNAFNIADSADSIIQFNEAHKCGDFQYGKWGGAIYTYNSENIEVIGNKIINGGGITFGVSKDANGATWLDNRNTGGTIENNMVEDATFGLEIFADNVIVSGNDISGATEYALNIIGEDVTAQDNDLCGDTLGVLVEDKDIILSAEVSINENTICNGLDNSATEEVNAENNWWGTAVESEIDELIAGNVDYNPWLYDPEGELDEPQEWVISLSKGMNLISIPLMSEESDYKTVLNNIKGNLDKVWVYVHNKITNENEWKWMTYDGSWDRSSSTDSFTGDIVPGYGYVVFMDENDILYGNGRELGAKQLPTEQITLSPGWNLIGHRGLDSKPVVEALRSIDFLNNYRWDKVFTLNNARDGYEEVAEYFSSTTEEMFATKGYWVSVITNDGVIYL